MVQREKRLEEGKQKSHLIVKTLVKILFLVACFLDLCFEVLDEKGDLFIAQIVWILLCEMFWIESLLLCRLSGLLVELVVDLCEPRIEIMGERSDGFWTRRGLTEGLRRNPRR